MFRPKRWPKLGKCNGVVEIGIASFMGIKICVFHDKMSVWELRDTYVVFMSCCDYEKMKFAL
ncbi:hypothetical protein CMK22_01225 [Candidatus Poribacteria bacterium]|nr:hypothetical protein [Candidatus Poribacteria bacterium]